MSRQLKRLQKEKEQLFFNDVVEQTALEESEDDETIKPKMNSFLHLFDDQMSNENDLIDEEDEIVNEEEVPPVMPTKQKVKKSTKKKGNKASKSNKVKENVSEDNEFDDFDKTLKELSEKYKNSSIEPPKANRKNFLKLFQVDTKNLNPTSEMRRIFGSKVVNDALERNQRNQLRSGRGVKTLAKRTYLAQSNDTWPRIEKQLGLDMELIENDLETDTKLFTFTHSKKYQEVQKKFLDCQLTHDPNTIAHLLRMHPYHIDSLLQLSEVSRHNGNMNDASELIEKALYAFENAFHSMFIVASGKCRLCFDRVESRSFFLALYKHSILVSRKGCWKTSYELTKFLLSLDLDNDPMGCLLVLDLYSIKSQMFEVMIVMWDAAREIGKNLGGLNCFPNWWFSTALAKKELHGEDQANCILEEALLTFPYFITKLYNKLGIVSDFQINPYFFYKGSGILGDDKESPILTLIELYLERSSSLWKEPENLEWLKKVFNGLHSDLKHRNLKTFVDFRLKLFKNTEFDLPLNIKRHVYISELNSAVSNLPLSSIGSFSVNDPLPPETAVASVYDVYLQERARASNPFAGAGVASGFVRSLLPWLNIPNNIRDLPQQRREAVNVVENLNQEEETIRYVEEAIRRQGQEGRLPGMFPEGAEEQESWISSIRDYLFQSRLFAASQNNAEESTPDLEESIYVEEEDAEEDDEDLMGEVEY
ncbi:Transcription factor 25 [Clydaea vesicula]|uniref:Transcription factor 25 n=1 Tax=Clydaea vesicula TaxID=447962 RepID=A0AAD5U604_9FUNG|nr:Transcription factor 25 [Clydaea vesicula]